MAPKNTCPPPPPSSATNGVRAHPFHARNLNVSGNTASIAERGADDLLPRGHPAAGAPRRLPLHGSLRDAVGLRDPDRQHAAVCAAPDAPQSAALLPGHHSRLLSAGDPVPHAGQPVLADGRDRAGQPDNSGIPIPQAAVLRLGSPAPVSLLAGGKTPRGAA